MIYHARTDDIVVKVRPGFVEQDSDPLQNHYVWSYHVRIENAGEMTMQLLTRHWRITDSFGNEKRVDDDGVVGQKPILGPHEYFEYQSGVHLKTPSGFMAGSYVFEDEDANEYEIQIPAFSLDSPYQPVVLQ